MPMPLLTGLVGEVPGADEGEPEAETVEAAPMTVADLTPDELEALQAEAEQAEAAAKGAAVGAAAGITLGGAKGVMNQEVPRKVGEDLHNRSLENRPAPANDVSHGFIFFPGEAKEQPRELRLALQEVDTRIVHSLILGF